MAGSGKRDQEIKSLKDMIPPSLNSSVSPPRLNFGEQEVRVYLSGAFNFPGIKQNGFSVPVTQYEWQIPTGWRAKAGSAKPAGTYLTSSGEIKLISDASSGGEVKVRGVNDCVGSGDYSEYSWPLTFTRVAEIEFLEYPETVPIGEMNTYQFSVLQLTGVSFEWHAPTGWSINGGGNSYTGGNVVQITTSECPTNEKVKVRMEHGNNYSSWTECPATVELPLIKAPAEGLMQYQSATFSLDMPDEDIASVEWLVNGNSVGIATHTSSLSCIISDCGTVSISARLTLKSCPTVVIPEIEIEVTKAPKPVIVGPQTVCDKGTYTLENLDRFPPETAVQWRVSNNNLTIVSEQGKATCLVAKNNDGTSSIQASINLSGNSLAFTQKIWVGAPFFSVIEFPSDMAIVHLRIENPEHKVDDMEITNVTWVKTGGNGTLSGDFYNAVAQGRSVGDSGYVSGTVTAYNSCGHYSESFTVFFNSSEP